MQESMINEFLEQTRVKSVEFICLGDVVIESWYFSPIPKQYYGKILYICPFCLYFYK